MSRNYGAIQDQLALSVETLLELAPDSVATAEAKLEWLNEPDFSAIDGRRRQDAAFHQGYLLATAHGEGRDLGRLLEEWGIEV